MTATLLLAAFGTALAAIPLAGPPERRSWQNPALIVFAATLWSLPLKALYIAWLRPSPNPGRDRLFVHADSSAIFVTGALLLCLALAGYALGFHLHRGSASRAAGSPDATRLPIRWRLWAFWGVCAAAFAGYLITSGIDLRASPLSAKRFAPSEIGVPTRFLYPPYYLLKLAATSSSLAFAVSIWLCRARNRLDRRASEILLAASVLLALAVGHFASLRLFLLLMILQIFLAADHLRPRKGRGFLAILGLLTLSSFFWITLVERSLPAAHSPEPDAPSSRALDPLQKRGRAFLASTFEGRYLLDLAKLAHLGDHFPTRRPYLLGRGYLGLAPTSGPDASPADGTFNRYLARAVFAQSGNNIPAGFAGELYLNFGPLGLVLGFLGLGAFHRRVLERLTGPPLPTLEAAAWLCIVPTATIVVLNSGLVSALTRAAVDLGVLALVSWPVRSSAGPPTPPER